VITPEQLAGLLGKYGNELVSIAVEGKVHEDFDKTLKKWYNSDDTKHGRKERFDYLCRVLGLQGKCSEEDESLKYQLFHRTASAIIEAERFCAKHAVMLVHTFYQDSNLSHFDDYQNFAKLFAINVNDIKENALVSAPEKVGSNKNIQLHFAWVKES
jgi:uncharacterized protein DUF6946